jgi:predicted nucleic acid-binding protein
MRAVDTNVLVRLVTRDDRKQVAAAEAFVNKGAWVSTLVLMERTSDSIRGIERLERFERNKLPLHPSRLQLTLGRCPQCVTPERHAALHAFGG